MASYVYSVASDFPDGKVNPTKLDDEIRASSITTALDGVVVIGDVLTLYFKASLSPADKTTLDGDTSNPAGGLIAVTDNTPSSITEVDVMATIKEESVPTNGKFQFTSLQFTVPAETTAIHDQSWPFPISVLDFWWITDVEDRGDVVSLLVGPDTPTGALTVSASAADTLLNVQSTVVDNTCPGDTIRLYDGSSTSEELLVIARDSDNATLTVESGASLAFSAATPTYVLSTSRIVVDCEIGREWRISVGRGKIGASYIPANVVVRTVWQNKAPKRICGTLAGAVAINDTVLSVAFTENVYVGDPIEISDGVNTDSLGSATRVDRVSNTITVTTPSTNTYSPSDTVYVNGKRIVGYMEYLR